MKESIRWRYGKGAFVTRASFRVVEDVPVENLLLDLSNARIRSGQDQADCISRILRKESQFLALATDIAENGLSTAPILVQPGPKRTFIVWDGNRRVTALKLLNKPSLCPRTLIRKRLEILAQKHAKSIPNQIDVLACSDTTALIAEVLKRHAGELGGVGQVNWSAFLRSVFMTSHNLPEANRRAAMLFLWAEEHGVEVADEIKVTSLTRFLTHENLKLLGFEIPANGVVKPLIATEKAIAVAQRLAEDFSPGGKVGVDEIFTPESAKRYVASVLVAAGVEVHASAKPERAGDRLRDRGAAGDRGKSDDGDGVDDAGPPGDAGPAKRRPRTPTKESWDRTRLLGRGGRASFDVPVEERKARNLVVELGKLNPYEVPLAVAALLRMLIEFSELHYRRTNRGIPAGDGKKGNLKKTADHMLAKERIDEGDHANFMRYVKEPGTLLHYETLNAYMHAPKAHPVGQTLCQFYDDVEPFLRACWD